MVKISKTYTPNLKEKYMCEKHKAYFKKKLNEWKSEIIRTSNEALYNNSMDDLMMSSNSLNADGIHDSTGSFGKRDRRRMKGRKKSKKERSAERKEKRSKEKPDMRFPK